MPVSSRSSRSAASIGASPVSPCPFGMSQCVVSVAWASSTCPRESSTTTPHDTLRSLIDYLPAKRHPASSCRRGLADGGRGGGLEHQPIDRSTHRPAEERHDPEKPQLPERPAALEHSHAGTARRIDGGIG